MEMKSANFKVQEDMNYGQLVMIVSTPDADMKGNQDYIIGQLGITYRRRRFKVGKYNEISIRNSRASGAKTERQKILDGECKSQLFIWEFADVWVICILSDILEALQQDIGYVKENKDGITSAYYISIRKVNHLLITK